MLTPTRGSSAPCNSRATGDQSQTIHVNLQIKGTAVDGTDYALLSASKKLNPGKMTKPIKIIPVDESYHPGGKKTVRSSCCRATATR